MTNIEKFVLVPYSTYLQLTKQANPHPDRTPLNSVQVASKVPIKSSDNNVVPQTLNSSAEVGSGEREITSKAPPPGLPSGIQEIDHTSGEEGAIGDQWIAHWQSL